MHEWGNINVLWYKKDVLEEELNVLEMKVE